MRKKAILFIIVCVLVSMTFVGCKKDVKDATYSLEYNGKTYEGKYTGVMEDDKPIEKGKFISGEEGSEKYLIYDGEWKKGKMKGKGKLSTDNYVVHYPEINDTPAKDRTGVYSGDVVDGVANGKGTFEAKNDENVKYIYEGDWVNGLLEGKGKRTYEDDYYPIQEGNFKDGSFVPTVSEAIKALGTYKNNSPYSLSEDDINFIDKNEKAFLKHDKKVISSNMLKSFSESKFRKSRETKKPGFVKFNSLHIFQVMEENYWGYDITEIMCDRDDTIFLLYYFGKSDKLAEDNTISLTLMPHSYATYEDINGNTPWAISGTVVKVGD